jgi:hypothetical protein
VLGLRRRAPAVIKNQAAIKGSDLSAKKTAVLHSAFDTPLTQRSSASCAHHGANCLGTKGLC